MAMKLRLRRFLVVLLVMTCVINAPLRAQKTTPERPTGKAADTESREFRRQQLQILHDNLLTRTLDSIKKMDEVALRLSARNQVITNLWESKILSDKHLGLKRSLALDAIGDLADHQPELPPFMLDYLAADLGALIEKYHPDLVEKFKAVRETTKSGKRAIDIRSLFELKNGDVLAASRIRQLLAQGDDVKELNFWLEELRKQRSREFQPLLREVIAIAERGPQLSFETLLWLNPIYFHAEVPRPLQQRFATMILSRTHPSNFVAIPAPQSAYELLNRALPYIQQLLPERYQQAMSQSLVLRSAINQTQLASEERAKRLKDSLTPIEDLVAEAEAAKSKNERNELLAEAAGLALQKEEFSTCLDIVEKLDLDLEIPGQPGFWRNWSSQFLTKLVKNAAAAKELEIAERAALGMTASLAKVQAVTFMMRQWSEAGDKDAAHRLFLESIKTAESISSEFEKVNAYVVLSVACRQVDESQQAQLMLSCVKALNSLNSPTTPRDQQPYQGYVRNLDNTGYQVTRGFRELTTKDENAAIALVNQINKSDLRAFALIGVLSGLSDLIAKAGD